MLGTVPYLPYLQHKFEKNPTIACFGSVIGLYQSSCPVPYRNLVNSVADPDPGSGAFLKPGSEIRNRFFSDPGSKTHIFES
jgi:hypothetical protein